MKKKMENLMKAVTKIVKSYADSTDCTDPEKNAEGMKKEIEEFLNECGIDDLGVKVLGMSTEEAKKMEEKLKKRKEQLEEENKEGIVYYLTGTGERIHIGDVIHEWAVDDNGRGNAEIEITGDNIDFYISKGVISRKKKGERQIPTGLLYYIKRIGNKMHFEPDQIVKFFACMDINYPIVSISILLREMAIAMDHYYDGNIKKCKSIFYISLVDGEIHEIPVNKIRNFRTIAAFRTREDAEIAMKIADKIFEELFRPDEEYNKRHFPSRC